MDVRIYQLIEGAREARGLTVIIDVFRAFTLECYLFAQGAERILPIGSIDEALALKRAHPEYVTFGERHGAQVEGFDFGNSPYQVDGVDLTGKICVHTTSAGTQGVVSASGADEIVTGSLVNARAVATYIRQRDPEEVSLVAMGNEGVKPAEEDLLCARYIKALLLNEPFDIQPQADALAKTAGYKFFDPKQPVFIPEDFPYCVRCDSFDFVIQVERDATGRLVNTRHDL